MCVDPPGPWAYDQSGSPCGPQNLVVSTASSHVANRYLRGALACAVAIVLTRGVMPDTRAEAAQPAPAQPPARVEPALTLTAEGFCSETRLRTSNVRITWRAGAGALGTGVASLTGATQRLETTVFKNGFNRGLYVALPIGVAGADQPIAAIAPTTAVQQAPPATRRAYQIRLIEVNAARVAVAADGASEMDAVVENLEPGLNYLWRMAIDAAAGRIVSPSVTVRALVCPADLVEPPPTTTPRRQP